MVKYGTDRDLEESANKILAADVRNNKRTISRDLEKAAFEAGLTLLEDLQYYDPSNDWDTQDSVFGIAISPDDTDVIEPSICAGVGDGNDRARNPKRQQRHALTRHVEDDDSWGPTGEDIPLLGINEGPRKACTRCKRSRGLSLFWPDKRNADGLRSWCKDCQREARKLRNKKRRNGA